MTKVRLILAGFALTCASCISVQPKDENIWLTTDTEAVRTCRFIANIESNDIYRNASSHYELRKEAAKRGANAVLLVGPASVGEDARAMGEAYGCPASVMPASFVSAEQHSRPPTYCPMPAID